MPNRRARRSQVIRGLIGVAAVVLAAVIIWALLVPGTDWLAHHDVGSAKGSLATARDAARGRLLFLGVGLFTAGTLIYTGRSFTLSRRTFELTEQGQVTDRYTKAIEQLGSDKLDVRIGGIYALERIARDSAKDHPTVMEVLTAFIRDHSREPWPVDKDGVQDGEKTTRPDVQAAVTVIGRRNPRHDRQPVDLHSAVLARANLVGATLTEANLAWAHLDGADLSGADLSGADLTVAFLTDASLIEAHLDGAHLNDAHLTRAHLTRAYLDGAYLDGAHFDGAYLDGAYLDGAHFGWADLTEANLDGATLTGAHLDDATLTRVRWPEGAQVPEGWIPDSDAGLLKRVDGLSGIMGGYL